MSIKPPEWTSNLIGPNIQEDGNNKGRQPNLNFGAGLSVTTDAINKRNTVSIDSTVNPTPGWLNIRSFGAAGNRVADDTLSILAAIASASLPNAPARTVFFPSGSYRVTAALPMNSNASDVVLLGEPGATIFTEFLTNNVITVQGTRNGVRGLRIVAAGIPSGGSLFRLVGNDTFVEDCTAENCWTGFFMSTGARQKLRRNTVTDARSTGIVVGSTNFPSVKSIVEANTVLFSSGNCLTVHDCRDVLVSNNLLYSGSDNVVFTSNAQRVTFTNNLVGASLDDAITVLAPASHLIITDNILENCVGDPIVIDPGITGSIIRDNRYQNCIRDGISFTATCPVVGGVLQLPGDLNQLFEIDTEGLTATDDVVTIRGGVNGQRATFGIVNNARIVTFKHATGNLRLQGDWVPDNSNSRLELEYQGGGTWFEISRNNLATGGGGGGSGADAGVQYVTMGATGSLLNERILTAGTGLTRTDGGAGGNVTLAIDNNVVATVSGTRFTGGVTGSAGMAFNQQTTTTPLSASANSISFHALSGSAGVVPYVVNNQGRGTVLAPFPTHRVNGTLTPGAGLVTPLTIPVNDNSFAMVGARVIMWTPGTTTLLLLETEMRVTRSLGGSAFKLAAPSEFRSTNSSSLYCNVDVSGNNAVVQLSASHANTAYVAEAWFHTQNLPT